MEPDTDMEQQASIILGREHEKKRKSRVLRLDSVNKEQRKSKAMARTEYDDLNLHVSLCEQRYKELETRLEALDERLTSVEDKVSNIKTEMLSQFNDIRLLIEKQNSARWQQLIATLGAVAVAIIGAVGYIASH